MKMKTSTGRKLRYGATSVALTALIVAAIIIINVIFSLVVYRYNLYVDLTPDLHFTISDECYALLDGSNDDDGNSPIEMLEKFRAENKEYNAANGLSEGDEGYRDEHVMINILFPTERDVLEATETTKYVVVNADELRTKYPDHISVEFVNGQRNPSRLTKYLSSNTEVIDLESVIIECGTEYRIRSISSFYLYDNDAAVAYNGEKAYASSILAVTRAEAPLACYTVNHGEAPTGSLLTSIEDAGYRYQPIDLSKEDIPEACRMLIVFDPKQDFLAGSDGLGSDGELTKLDAFLEDRNAMMVFMNPDSYTGKLKNFEDFLTEWGIEISRQGNDPYLVRDTADSILGNSAAVVGAYGRNELTEGWTASMTSGASAPKVVFPNSAVLSLATGFGYERIERVDEESGEKLYIGYSGTRNRWVYDLFVTGENAVAEAGGKVIAKSTADNPLKLMTVSVQTYTEQEYLNAIEDSAYVMVCASTEFASDKYINSNAFGNADLLLTALQMAGREPVPVGLKYKEFANYTIETVTTEETTQYTVILTVAPIVVSFAVGVFVIVRRKNR